jgi:hypothetical protein
VVCFPSVGKLSGDAEVDGLVGGVSVEQVGYPGAGDHDARVPVAGCEHAQAACFQMEGRRVAPPGQRVHDDGDLEFGALLPGSSSTGAAASQTGLDDLAAELNPMRRTWLFRNECAIYPATWHA